MNGSDSIDAPLFLQSDEDRLKDFDRARDIVARWNRASQKAGLAPLTGPGIPPLPDRVPWPYIDPATYLPGGKAWIAFHDDRPVATPPDAKNGHSKKSAVTRADMVFAVLADCQWHFGHELTGPKVGGSEGLRRLRELRKDWNIEMRQAQGRASREYKLTGKKERGA